MTEGKAHQLIQDSTFQPVDHHYHHVSMKCTTSSSSSSSSSTSSVGEQSTESSSMSSSDTTTDDASSVSNPYDLSEIMSQLPIKRGLSKFYKGKSESFTSLARVATIEDLAKKAVVPYRRNNKNNLKATKSCGNGLSSCSKPYSLIPKAIIEKKTIRSSSLAALIPSQRGSFMTKSKAPLRHTHKNCHSYGQ